MVPEASGLIPSQVLLHFWMDKHKPWVSFTLINEGGIQSPATVYTHHWHQHTYPTSFHGYGTRSSVYF